MARFYGEMKGQGRHPVTCTGHRGLGITAHIRGWNIGVQVEIAESSDGRDLIRICKTGGSNNPTPGDRLVLLYDGVSPTNQLTHEQEIDEQMERSND